MKFIWIDVAGPGSSISIDRKGGLLRVQKGDENKVHDVFGSHTTLLDNPPPQATFEMIIDSVNDGWTYDLAVLEVDNPTEFEVPEEVIAAVNRGQFYVTSLTEAGQKVFGAGKNGNMVILLGKRKGRKRLYLASIGPRPTDLGSQDSVIAVLDILGYKNILSTTSLDELQIRMNRLLSFVDSASRLAGTTIALGSDSTPDLNLLPPVVEITTISDTIIVNAKSRMAFEAIETVCRVCTLIVDFGLFEGWLFRGALEVGEFARLKSQQRIFRQSACSCV